MPRLVSARAVPVRRWLCVAAILSWAPASALAQEELTLLRIDGPAIARPQQLGVTCRPPSESIAECTVRLRLEVEARGDLVFALAPADEDRGIQLERLGGAAPQPIRHLAAGETAVLEARANVRLTTLRDELVFMRLAPPLALRHILLGQSSFDRRPTQRVAIEPLGASEGVIVEGAVQATVDGVDAVRITTGGSPVPTVRLRMDTPWTGPPDGPIQHGGPLVSLGGEVSLDGASSRDVVWLGVGYELGILEYLVASLAVETDFDTLEEALVIEAATPGLALIIPSVSAGVGVVARQLGDRDADAALRLRLAAQSYALGLTLDFDYWPAIARWTLRVGARLSL